jgi:hypothetical protein
MRNYGSGLHRHMLRKTNVCANRRDSNKFKGNELVEFLRSSVRKWDNNAYILGSWFSNLVVTSRFYCSTNPIFFHTVDATVEEFFLLWVELCSLLIEVHVPCCQPWCHKCWRLANMIFLRGCDLIIALSQIGAACGMLQVSLVTKLYVTETYFPNECGMCVSEPS